MSTILSYALTLALPVSAWCMDKRAVAAGVILLWSGALLWDMQRLKRKPEFQASTLSARPRVSLFGKRLDEEE